MAKNPASKSYEDARQLATTELIKQGWVWVPEISQFRHSDGRRGRLAFLPDRDAPLVNHKSTWFRAVELVLPGRKPTVEDMMNRVPTISASIPVVNFWEN